MRKRILFAYLYSLVSAAVLLSACSRHDDTVVLKLAHVLDTGHSVHQGMVHMAERLEYYSDGKMRIDIYPSGQLGSERDTVELVQISSLAMTRGSAAPLEAFVPAMQVFSIPPYLVYPSLSFIRSSRPRPPQVC
jgi:TRAP-type C4-dicarboxylate transport system substrate-binding protein